MPAPLPPVDPDVKLPASVQAAGAAAEAIHRQVYADQGSDPAPQPEPQPEPSPAPNPEPAPPAPPAPQPEPQPEPRPEPQQDAPAEDLSAAEWRHRFLSMKGRFEQAQQTMGGMHEQIAELGSELIRTQQLLQRPPAPAPEPLVTEADVNTFGADLIDVVTRVSRAAVMPELKQAHTAVQQVDQKVSQQALRAMYNELAAAVPNWSAINHDIRFKAWCGLRDIYSGEIRGVLLNAAVQAADAPRVIAFFKKFLEEEQATGQLPAPQPQPAQVPPRVAAVPLETLAAPGRAKPATGNSPLPSDKPIFTRGQISKFYDDVRRGVYAGREQEKDQMENSIFLAQREGRIR